MSLGAREVITLAFSDNMGEYVHQTKPLLVMGGGVYLLLICFDWLFTEKKNYAFKIEKYLQNHKAYYFIIGLGGIGLILVSNMMIPILIGVGAFYLVKWIKDITIKRKAGAWGKILYLEMLDAS